MTWLKDDSNRLGVMLGLSLAFHLVLLSIKFAAPELRRLQDHLPALEVVLVNTKTKSKPIKADALAQANLDRGGNTDAERRMKSPLPVPKNKPQELSANLAAEARQASEEAAPIQATVTQKQQRVKELEKQARELMTQIKSSHAVESQSSQPASAATPEQGKQETSPKTLNAAELYGSLRMTVNIKSDGTIESIELNKSSGYKVLDESAKRIVELAAPYAEFPTDVRKDTDIISITRTWTFTREDTLSGAGE